MSYDDYGQQYLTEDELVELVHKNPELDFTNVLLDDPRQFNHATTRLFAGYPLLDRYRKPSTSIEEFDKTNQRKWNMPKQYKEFDIVTWLTEQCENDEQVNRVAEELLLYDERNLIQLLQFLKYMVDTFRQKNVVWGVGRGSSVSSYVLYLIGVHRVDSIKYKLNVDEFLR